MVGAIGAVEHQPAVDLIREHPDVALDRRLSNMFQRGERHHAAGGIARRVQDDHPRAVAQRGVERGQVEREVGLLPQRHGHRHAARHADHGRIGGEAGVGVDHLVTGAHQGQGREEERGLGAGADDHVLRPELQAALGAGLLGDGAAQRGCAGRGGVARVAGLDCFDPGLRDVLKRRHVRLADFEMDDGPPGGFERLGAGEHVIGALGLEMGHAVGEGHSRAILSGARPVRFQRVRAGK